MQDAELTPLAFTAGIVKEQTPKTAEGYWTDANAVRFRFGKPELIGGWLSVSNNLNTGNLIGTPRALSHTRALDGTKGTLIGTQYGVFASDLSDYFNVTPTVTSLAAPNAFSTSAGSTRILVSVPAHGLTDGTFIGITSATASIGGNIVINAIATTTAVFQVSLISDGAFAIESAVTAAATSATTGGSLTIHLKHNAGLQSTQLLTGWGSGAWSGAFGWSSPPTGTIASPLRTWAFAPWGTDIMAVPSGGPLYRWPINDGLISDLVLVTAAPATNQLLHIEAEARHIVLYGTEDVSNNYDPLLVRWCSQENYDDWTPTITNTAGDFRLNSVGTVIRAVVPMRNNTLVLTDHDLFEQRYIGSNDVFGFTRAAESCGAISQNCAVEYNGVAYWMGNNGKFYAYDGRLQTIPCSVLRYVFQNLDPLQADKVCAGTVAQFDEVWWFYPSTSSPNGENDSYVVYNTVEKHWTIGQLARTAWQDGGTYNSVIATGLDGEGLFFHESGYSANGLPLTAHLQSAYYDIKAGNDIMRLHRFVPDFCCTQQGTPYTGTINVTLTMRKYPGGSLVTKGPYPVTGNTQKQSLRLRGRELAVRFDSADINLPWRAGDFRIGLQTDGFR